MQLLEHQKTQAYKHEPFTVEPGSLHTVHFEPTQYGYAGTLEGLPKPLRVRYAASGHVYLLPHGNDVEPHASLAVVSLWPGHVDAGVGVRFDLYNPDDVPVLVNALTLWCYPWGSSCPTCCAPLSIREIP